MTSTSERTVYGLTEEEVKELEDDDDEFFGETNESRRSDSQPESESDFSEGEEVEEEGILDDSELDARVLRVTGNNDRNTSVRGEPSTSRGGSTGANNGDVISLDSDPVYSDITSKLSAGCLCSGNCLSQFTADEVYMFHLSLFEMTKMERDLLILGKLQVLSRPNDTIKHARQAKPGKRQRVTCDYRFDHRQVCKDGFLFLHDIGTKHLKNLQKHLRENGPIPREHGLAGRAPATMYPYEVTYDAVRFIRNYAEIYGIPQPAARRGRADNPPIYLPASQNYTIVHSKYVEASLANDPQVKFLKYKSFTSVWKRCLPDIVFMTPRSDVCATCEQFRIDIRDVISEEDKVKLSTEFAAHIQIAQEEREYYVSSMKKAECELSKVQGSQSRPQYAHYTFDFAEQVHIPHHSRQVGPLYFKVCRKIQVFGICCDSNKKQINYLIDEDESIGANGANTHGPNSVISMLDHYFANHALKEDECHLHCDNCVGQNKNNYVTGYLAWRVIRGKHQEIVLSFMRVGHTRCLVDGHFGLIKKIYRQSDTDTLQQMADVVERSSTNNSAQLYDWQWRDWDSFFKTLFRKIPLITKYQHFRFPASAPGTVYVRKSWNSEEKAIKLLKRGVTCAKVRRARIPSIIRPAGLTEERKQYLYENIRPFVTPRYQDITCPAP